MYPAVRNAFIAPTWSVRYTNGMTYQTRHISKLFDVSKETTRVWAREFAQYLSPTAQPESGQKRVYTSDDLSVFALVAQSKTDGLTYEQIHALLQAGERGNAPHPEVAAIASNESGKVVQLTRRIMQLERELQAAQSHSDKQDGVIEELRQQLEATRAQISTITERAIRAETLLELERSKTNNA